MSIKVIHDLMQRGKYDYAMQLATSMAMEGNLEAMAYQCRILDHQGLFQHESQIAEELICRIDEMNNPDPSIIIIGSITKSFSRYRLGRIKEAIDLINKAQKYMKKIDKEKESDLMGRLLFVEGLVKNELGMREEGIEKLIAAYEIWDQLENKLDKAITLNSIGVIHYERSELVDALKSFKKALAILEEVGNETYASKVLNNIGLIHIERGDYDKAATFLQRGIEIKKKLNSSHSTDFLHLNLGRIFFEQGNLEEAEQHFLRSLQLRRIIGNDINVSHSLYYLALTYTAKGEFQQAEQYISELEVLELSSENRIVTARYLASKAFWLKKQKRLYQKMQAYPLFEKIIKEYDTLDHNLTVFAIENLIDLTLIEATVSNEEWLVEEIYQLGQKLLKIGQMHRSYPVVINSLILISKIELIRKNMERAMNALEQAILIAEEQGLENHKEKAKAHQKEIENQISTWAKLIESNADVVERVRQSDILDYLTRITHVVKQRG
ncbi:MAG: hypothetical protein D6732_21840 [Methanobacteriota archaeon]|nr:MAG: hypothetical protein D6732_21840 [Euryarchaeota archaeon]